MERVRRHDRQPGIDSAGASVPREVALLLEQLEHVARQIGRSEAMQEALAARISNLEARLAGLGGRLPITPFILPRIPDSRPAAVATDPARLPLVRLLDQMELLGRELGRAETAPPDGESRPEIEPSGRARIDLPATADPLGTPNQERLTGASGDGEGHGSLPTPGEAPAHYPTFRPIRPAQRPPTGPPLPARRPWPALRNRRLLAATGVALVVLALLTAAALALSDDDEAPSTITAGAVATVPTPAATLAPLNGSATRLPGIYSFINTPTPAPTGAAASPAAPTPTGTPGVPIASAPGVGSTRATLEAQFGRPQVTRPDGVSVYFIEQVAISVLYSRDDQALRIVLDFTLANPPLSPTDADALLASYRPRDATPLRGGSPVANTETRVYRSALLAAAFDGHDTAGRDAGRYREELSIDPATNTVTSVTMEVGET